MVWLLGKGQESYSNAVIESGNTICAGWQGCNTNIEDCIWLSVMIDIANILPCSKVQDLEVNGLVGCYVQEVEVIRI